MKGKRMDENDNDYWFPVKKYGFGWGMPNCWQGWIVLLAFVVLTIAGRYMLHGRSVALIITYYTAATVVFLIVVYCKGEKRTSSTDG